MEVYKKIFNYFFHCFILSYVKKISILFFYFFLLFLFFMLIILYPYSKSRILEIVNRLGFFGPFLLFILPFPGFPKDLLCYFAGFIGVKKKDFLLSLLLGRVPIEIIWVLAGAGIYKFFIPPN